MYEQIHKCQGNHACVKAKNLKNYKIFFLDIVAAPPSYSQLALMESWKNC
jgi:hypothetical protein